MFRDRNQARIEELEVRSSSKQSPVRYYRRNPCPREFGFGYGKANTQPTIKAKEILEKVANSIKAVFLAHRRVAGKKKCHHCGKSHRLIFDISSDDEEASAVNHEEKDILNLSRVDKCLISMEELEMDIKNMIHKQMQEKDRSSDPHSCVK